MIFSFFIICLLILYFVFILSCLYYWNKISETTYEEIQLRKINTDVIVPMRNEAANIQTLIESLKKQNYPVEYFRIIFVDDHSSDNSLELTRLCCDDLKITNAIFLSSPKESKKEAIRFGLENSTSELIVMTDADTSRDNQWLSSMVNHYAVTNAAMICGPVKLTGGSNFTECIQEIEFCGLTAMSASAIAVHKPMFCNGANLAFSRAVFFALNGFDGSKSHSGDDTQLMLKIHSSGIGKISFIKDKRAIVSTAVVAHKNDFISQRSRWASKIPSSLSAFTIFIAIISWLVHSLLLCQMIYSILNLDFSLFFFLYLLKVIPEILLLQSAGKFYRKNIRLWMIISVQPLYWFYIFYVGLVSPFKSYQWKNRKIRGNSFVGNPR
jgi:biofilm PGA synthesis N-glycosyltransferase PgaC